MWVKTYYGYCFCLYTGNYATCPACMHDLVMEHIKPDSKLHSKISSDSVHKFVRKFVCTCSFKSYD